MKLLYTDEFMLEILIKVEKEEVKEQEKALEKKKLMLKQLELKNIKLAEKNKIVI